MGETEFSKLDRWAIIGRPPAGRVAALAVGRKEGYTAFVGTRVGLFRAKVPSGGTMPQWSRLSPVPLEVMSLAVSPSYAEDGTLLAGTARGLFLSRDGGDHWQAARTPIAETMVLALCFSPNYKTDGIALAGTLEDGILYSDTRGEEWSYTGVGLLDTTIYSLAISPGLEMIFAGAETALYYSYNGGRAWKQLDFPEEATPILSLALSPHFSQDRTLYVGTEMQGLYRSTDLGRSWHKLNLPATCVNALALSPADGTLFAATDTGLYSSGDGGRSWNHLWDNHLLSLAITDENTLFAGSANEGVWLTADGVHWCSFFTAPARPLLGMALSPCFDADQMAFLYGPQEGIWRTADGGRSWECLGERLPSLDIRSLAVSPGFPQDRVLVAASTDGILLSRDAGDSWSLWSDEPASLVTCSPSGRLLAAVCQGGTVRVASELQGPWESVPGPWEGSREVLAFALDDRLRCRVAILDRREKVLSIWEGQSGNFRQVLSRPASANPVAAFWLPTHGRGEGSWYASLDHQVWEFQYPAGAASALPTLIFETAREDKILSLTGARGPTGQILLACTGETLFKSTETKAWTVAHHFGDERAIALALSPAYPSDSTAFALLLGGAFCQGVVGQ